MSNLPQETYNSFEDSEIEKAWNTFIIYNNICEDELKSLKIAFFAGWKGHESFYRNQFSDDGK